MTDRISIPALRQWATAKPIQLDEVALENQRTLLALVEAVEAARDHLDRHDPRSRQSVMALEVALARFDFGGDT